MTARLRSTFATLVGDIPGAPAGHSLADPPADLLDFLADLLILRGVPLTYIVPDARLLPTESIRFFHVDPNWTARLIDGALAAASFGSLDVALHGPLVTALRRRAELRLAERLFPEQDLEDFALPQLSGFLLRSEIVRRWPGLMVEAWDDTARTRQLVVARKEQLAAGLLLVIVAGVPIRLELVEPSEGTRFGVEEVNGAWTIQVRDAAGKFVFAGQSSVTVGVPRRPQHEGVDRRVLDIAALAGAAAQKISGGNPPPLGPAHLSLCLQQAPYPQVFQDSSPEEDRRIARTRRTLLEAIRKQKGL